MRAWWNGRHAALRGLWPAKGRASSTLAVRTLAPDLALYGDESAGVVVETTQEPQAPGAGPAQAGPSKPAAPRSTRGGGANQPRGSHRVAVPTVRASPERSCWLKGIDDVGTSGVVLV